MILAELVRLQHHHGWVSDDAARDVARRLAVPLHRVEGLVSFYPLFRRDPPPRLRLQVCRDASCWLADGGSLCGDAAKLAGGDVAVEEVSCPGLCDTAPVARVNDVPVPGATAKALADIVSGKLAPPTELPIPAPRSLRLTAGHPPAPAFDPDAVIAALDAAGLRGMGGAGFPTGRKWTLVRAAAGDTKYAICNADESEPGTFKDRMLLEEHPEQVIEGMALAARVIGAARAIIYLRHEYDVGRRAVERALASARDLPCPFELFVSPGGYIQGEETALLEALEDRRGEPRNKPPFPGVVGLDGKPTLINNVETFAAAAAIWRRGADWWAAQGVRGHKGLKLMAVSGHVARPDVYEIPMGTTVAELIAMTGGVTGGARLLAFAPGGASSSFLPAAAADAELDFDSLATAGSMLGSGALMVVGEGTDLLALGTNITRFFRNESCGKCVPCRVGSQKAVTILDEVLAGKRSRTQLDIIPELDDTLRLTSICGLGYVALLPVRSILERFPEPRTVTK